MLCIGAAMHPIFNFFDFLGAALAAPIILPPKVLWRRLVRLHRAVKGVRLSGAAPNGCLSRARETRLQGRQSLLLQSGL